MTYFIFDRSGRWTLDGFFDRNAYRLDDKVGILCYDELDKLNGLECGALVFSDFDRLSPQQIALARSIYERIERAHPEVRLLNKPGDTLLRYDLLRKLYSEGLNRHNVWRVGEDWGEIRYPVFVREEHVHSGPLTPLIRDESNLRAHILALKWQGYPPDELLIMEFLDVAESDGTYRKRAAVILGDWISPRYLDWADSWLVKSGRYVFEPASPEHLEEVREYMNTNPHEYWLRRVFDLAGVSYGRIDYGVYAGKPEVWEINLNPDFGAPVDDSVNLDTPLMRAKEPFMEGFVDRLKDLAGTTRIITGLDQETIDAFKVTPGMQRLKRRTRYLRSKKPWKLALINALRTVLTQVAGIALAVGLASRQGSD